MGRNICGYGTKNMSLLQNKCKPSQLGKLIIPLTGKLVPKGKNCSIKLRKYHFCTTTSWSTPDDI